MQALSSSINAYIYVQGVPLYEFIRQEAGLEGPYTVPVPFLNVLNGGVHSGNTMAFQELMIAPTGAESFAEGIRLAVDVYSALKTIIADRFGAPGERTEWTYRNKLG